MPPKDDLTESEMALLRRPWRTKRIGDEEYVRREDAEAALRILTEQLVSLRNYQYEHTRTLSGVLDRLCSIVTQQASADGENGDESQEDPDQLPVTRPTLN